MSHDWSEEAVFLRTRRPLPLGSTLRLAVRLPDPKTEIDLSGVVTRVAALDDLRRNIPPGMVVSFGAPPQALRLFLEKAALAQNSRPSLLDVTVIPVILVVGEDERARHHATQVLTGSGYEVREARGVEGATLLLDHGAQPDVIVTIGDTGEVLDHILKHMAQLPAAGRLQLAVEFAAGGQRPAGYFECPVVVLPRHWPAEQLPSLLRLFAPIQDSRLQLMNATPGRPALLP